jgi:hypothetical protein
MRNVPMLPHETHSLKFRRPGEAIGDRPFSQVARAIKRLEFLDLVLSTIVAGDDGLQKTNRKSHKLEKSLALYCRSLVEENVPEKSSCGTITVACSLDVT